MAAHRFSVATASCPQRIWAVLTNPAGLYGVAATSTWKTGAGVCLSAGGAPPLRGRVLHTTPPERLSFVMDDPSGESTYVTWELRGVGSGAVVRLYVDETTPSAEDDAEDVWLPILGRLTDLVRA